MYGSLPVCAALRRRPRVLFVAEAATLCHVARPLVLAGALDPTGYDIHFACAPPYAHLLQGKPFTYWPLQSIPSRQVLDALASGRRMFELDTLRRYVHEDFTLIDQVRPDVIVGDLRFSLSVSARLTRVPYLMICNAYWSPYARQRWHVPEVPATHFLGPRLAGALFSLVRPFIFHHHTAPMNRLRREFGLPSLGHDHRQLYTDADHALYADVPELVPTRDRPRHHHYIGPITWSYPAPLPTWWRELPDDRPLVYVGLGSSGRIDRLANVFEGLSDLDVTVVASTVGRLQPGSVPANVRWAEFLPSCDVAARADVTICHGGSAAAYVALAAGHPVLGIPSNMDQHLTMNYIAQAGAGEALRGRVGQSPRIREAVRRILRDSTMRSAAVRLGQAFARHHAPTRFRAILEDLVASPVQRPLLPVKA